MDQALAPGFIKKHMDCDVSHQLIELSEALAAKVEGLYLKSWWWAEGGGIIRREERNKKKEQEKEKEKEKKNKKGRFIGQQIFACWCR